MPDLRQSLLTTNEKSFTGSESRNHLWKNKIHPRLIKVKCKSLVQTIAKDRWVETTFSTKNFSRGSGIKKWKKPWEFFWKKNSKIQLTPVSNTHLLWRFSKRSGVGWWSSPGEVGYVEQKLWFQSLEQHRRKPVHMDIHKGLKGGNFGTDYGDRVKKFIH